MQVNPPALERFLRIISVENPELVTRMAAALDILLEGIHSSAWHEVAWIFSELTEGGFPFEFAFSSADNEIRYTTEVAGPEVSEAARLSRAEQLIVRLGTRLPSEGMRDELRKIQEAGPLRYGAWIGGRHGPGGDRYKLYIEVPETASHEADNFVCNWLGDVRLLSTRTTSFRMIGYEPSSSRMELYFSTECLEPWEVRLLLRRVGLASRETELFAFIEEAYCHPIKESLPGSKHFFSFSISNKEEPAVFSLFTFARSVFGDDASIRRRLLTLGARKRWNLHNYALLSEPLTNRTGWKTNHGMVSFLVSTQGPPALHIGLRPPDVSV